VLLQHPNGYAYRIYPGLAIYLLISIFAIVLNRLLHILLFALSFFGIGLESGYAQTDFHVHTLQNTPKPFSIGRFITFYEDTHNQLSFDEVRQQRFTGKDAEIPNFNITKSTIWGKIAFTTKESADWYMCLDPATYNEIRFYSSNNGGSWQEEQFGNAFPNAKRPLAVNHYYHRLHLQPGDTFLVYFRIQDYYPMQLDMKVGSLEAFIVSDHNANLYDGICYGIMLMMLLYNLYLYITQRTVIYLYYVMYIFFSMCFTAYLTGYALHFPEPLMVIIHFAPIVPPAGFGIFGLLFTLKLFNEALGKRLKRVIVIFMFIAGADMVMSAIPSLVYLSENIIQPLGLILGILCITSAITAVRKKQSSGIYYLVGFGAYMLSLFYLILTAQGVLVANSFTWHALVTGSALESIMLSFALGDKVKVILREKEKAQEDALHQAMENERLVKGQNAILEQKVKERTLELEEKNKEILDSIHYARTIQQTLLAQAAFLQEHLPEHFVFFKPKDIVSGDFYWSTVIHEPGPAQGDVYLAVCDSTGHGVPGAFMSLLNISFLNEAINEKNIFEPNEVFNHVRERLIDTISKEGGKDGMDGILVRIDAQRKKVQYAAANNSPVLVHNNELTILNADKMPVGKGERTGTFVLYEIDVQPGDTLYLYTDGYADQFGGPKGKKFKYKQLDDLIFGNHQRSSEEQKQLLEQTFTEWKGNLEQIDDVLVIGIRF
jgi:serine phosphatase RsbU (regulator of sigma subunit)